MRLISDSRSAARGEITILAVGETAAAVIIYALIGVTFGTVTHILVASLVAPFWLLRTSYSVRLGLAVFDRAIVLHRFLFRTPGVEATIATHSRRQTEGWFKTLVRTVPVLAKILLEACYVLLSSIVIRAMATIAAIATKPILHLVAFRKNWRRLVFATDVGCLPEVIPGLGTQRLGERAWQYRPDIVLDLINTRKLLKGFDERPPLEKAIHGLVVIVFLFVGWTIYVPVLYVAPVILRVCVKGVSILYAPVLLVISSDPIDRRMSLGQRLDSIRHEPTSKLKLVFAAFSILAFTCSLFFPAVVTAVHDWVSPWSSGYFKLLAEFYVPSRLKGWQLATAVNGLLFLYLYWVFAPRAAMRLRWGVWHPKEVKPFLDRVVGVQMVLSVYSTLCAVAIFANFVLHHKFPAREWIWFPKVGV